MLKNRITAAIVIGMVSQFTFAAGKIQSALEFNQFDDNVFNKTIQVTPKLPINNQLFRGNDTIFKNGFELPVSTVVASTSFEETVIMIGVNDLQYVDTGDSDVAHDLVNNAGQTPVDQSGGTELGVNASYVPYDSPGQGVGLTDGDFVGVTNFTDNVIAFTDGDQGYQMQDPDGNMIVEFDIVDLTAHVNNSVSLDYFVQESGWEGNGTINDEPNDHIRIYVRDLTNATEIDILNTIGSDVDDLGIEDMWITGSVNLPDNIMMQLVVVLHSNGSTEALHLDRVIISGE